MPLLKLMPTVVGSAASAALRLVPLATETSATPSTPVTVMSGAATFTFTAAVTPDGLVTPAGRSVSMPTKG